jgi:hypothetical protein
MVVKTIDIELIRSKLSDAFIIGQSWADVALLFPEIDKDLYDEVASELTSKLNASQEQIRPKELYRGIGVEVDTCEQGLQVKEAYKDCPAMKLGIRVGDIINSINFQGVANLDLTTALKRLRNCDYPEGIIVEVSRLGESITLGYGLNIKTRVIDAKKKFPMSFTALTIGRRLMMSTQSSISIDSNSKLLEKKRSFEMAR